MQSGVSPSGETNHFLPPRRYLQLFGVQDESPFEVYCPFSRDRNEGKGYFLCIRLGPLLFDWKSRGKWPNDPKFGALAGTPRGEWTAGKSKMGDHGQLVFVKSDCTLVFYKGTASKEHIILPLAEQTPAGMSRVETQSSTLSFSPQLNQRSPSPSASHSARQTANGKPSEGKPSENATRFLSIQSIVLRNRDADPRLLLDELMPIILNKKKP